MKSLSVSGISIGTEPVALVADSGIYFVGWSGGDGDVLQSFAAGRKYAANWAAGKDLLVFLK